MSNYRITKEHCEKLIGESVCEGCGSKITAIETVDNSGNPTHWAGCAACMRFTAGVTPDVFGAVSKATEHMAAFEDNIIDVNRRFSDVFVRCLKHYKLKCVKECPFFTFKIENLKGE